MPRPRFAEVHPRLRAAAAAARAHYVPLRVLVSAASEPVLEATVGRPGRIVSADSARGLLCLEFTVRGDQAAHLEALASALLA